MPLINNQQKDPLNYMPTIEFALFIFRFTLLRLRPYIIFALVSWHMFPYKKSEIIVVSNKTDLTVVFRRYCSLNYLLKSYLFATPTIHPQCRTSRVFDSISVGSDSLLGVDLLNTIGNLSKSYELNAHN